MKSKEERQMHMCRFCKEDHNRHRMVKYAARHWAHFDCWLDAKGKELGPKPTFKAVLELLKTSLHGWQLEQFPVFKLTDWITVSGMEMHGERPVDVACTLLKQAISRTTSEKPAPVRQETLKG